MYLNEYVGKEAAGVYKSFGKIKPGFVVKYVWFEGTEEYTGTWYVDQRVYQKVSNIPGQRWAEISNKTRKTKNIQKFRLALTKDNFSAKWPTYEMPYLNCKVEF